jgi:protein tyrosine kinase modulator
MTIATLIEILKGRIRLIISLPLVAAGTALLVSTSMPTMYTTKATILLDYHRKAFEGELAGEFLPAGLQSTYLSTQIGIIKSRPVAKGVLELLDLNASPEWKGRFEKAESEESTSFEEWAVNTLLDHRWVTTNTENRLIDIWYRDPDPRIAAEIANAFVASYRQFNRQLSRDPVLETAHSVEDLLVELRNNLAEAENAVTTYQAEMGIMATDERLDVETRRLNELMQAKMEAASALQAAESRLNSFENMVAERRAAGSVSELRGNDIIRNLQVQLAQKESELAESATSLGNRHPQMRKLRAELRSLRNKLAAETGMVVSGVRGDFLQAQRLLDLAQKAEAAQKRKVMELKRLRDGLQPLLRELDSAREAYDRALSMYSEYAMHSNMNQTNVSLLSPAKVPLKPSSPKILRNVASAFFSGAMFALGLVFFLEVLDRRVRKSEEIQEFGVVGYLGELPKA